MLFHFSDEKYFYACRANPPNRKFNLAGIYYKQVFVLVCVHFFIVLIIVDNIFWGFVSLCSNNHNNCMRNNGNVPFFERHPLLLFKKKLTKRITIVLSSFLFVQFLNALYIIRISTIKIGILKRKLSEWHSCLNSPSCRLQR